LQLKSYKDNSIVALPSPNALRENFVSDWKVAAYFAVNDLSIFLPGDSDQKASCRARAVKFLVTNQNLEDTKCSNVPFC